MHSARPLPIPRSSHLLSPLAIAAATALFGATPAHAASDPAQEAIQDIQERRLKPEIIQNRFFLKQNRFEIAPSAGIVPNNSFVSNPIGGAYLAYHFSETLAAEGAFLYGPNTGNAGVKGLTHTLVDIAHQGDPETTFQQPLDRLAFGAMFNARWSPIYGKINLIGANVVNFDFYGTGGIGLVTITEDSATPNPDYYSAMDAGAAPPAGAEPAIVNAAAPTASHFAGNVGVGMNFFVSQSVAVKLDLRSLLYVAPQPDYGNADDTAEDRLYSTFVATAGVGIYVPKMKPRLFNF